MNNYQPLVSVIVPTYNNARYIEFCISSIQNQTFHNIEILIVNDGSIDDTAQIINHIASEDNRVLVFHQSNSGVSKARNMGIKNAHGQYIMFVDGDDWIEPNTVEILYNKICDSEADACFETRYYENNDKVCASCNTNVDEKGKTEYLLPVHLNYDFIASACMGLFDFQKINSCYFDESLSTLEDWEFNFRLLHYLQTYITCDIPLYHYRKNFGSSSLSPLSQKKLSCLQIPLRIQQFWEESKNQTENIDLGIISSQLAYMLLVHNALYGADSECIPPLKKYCFNLLTDKKRMKNVHGKRYIYVLLGWLSPSLFGFAYRLKNK